MTKAWFELWISCIQFRPSCGCWNFWSLTNLEKGISKFSYLGCNWISSTGKLKTLYHWSKTLVKLLSYLYNTAQSRGYLKKKRYFRGVKHFFLDFLNRKSTRKHGDNGKVKTGCKKSPKFQWKTSVLKSFFNKFVDCSFANLLRKFCDTDVFLWFLQNFGGQLFDGKLVKGWY